MNVRLILQLLGLGVSLVAIGIVVRQVDLSATVLVLGRAAPGPLLLGMAALGVQLVVLTLRWRSLLPPRAGGTTVPYRAVVEALLVGNLANATLPARLGEVARAVTIARRGAVDTAGSAGTVLLERVLDITVLCTAAVVAALVVGRLSFLSQFLALIAVAGLAVILLLMTAAVARLVEGVADRARHRLQGARRAAAIRWTRRLTEAVHAGRRPRVLLLALGATLLSVALDGVIFWAVGRSLEIELTFPQAILLSTAGVLVTGIPSAPANVGTFELAVAWVSGTFGVPTESGLALALVAHLLIVVPLSVGGAIVLLMSARGRQVIDARDVPARVDPRR